MSSDPETVLDEVPEETRERLLELYEPEAAKAWLEGNNPTLGDKRPIDVLRAGGTGEVLGAILAERSDSFA